MGIWITLGIIWIIVAIAFTIIMGLKHYNEGLELIDYLTFLFAYGIFWPVTLPMLLFATIIKKIIEKLHDRFA